MTPLRVLPPMLTPAAPFRCPVLCVDMTVAGCAARFDAAGEEDPCWGCDDGVETLAFIKKQPANPLYEAVKRHRAKHGDGRRVDRIITLRGSRDLDEQVYAAVERAGEAGINSGVLIIDFSAQYSGNQISVALKRLRVAERVVMGERAGRGFIYRVKREGAPT